MYTCIPALSIGIIYHTALVSLFQRMKEKRKREREREIAIGYQSENI